ncbi:TOBE domain-containing protein [Comamonas endophytica]|uniref:TOBE domain-containing protein n=1 Tax=Comamonas endophytica TaxID=2949090 RepID=UPI00360A328A
MQHPSSSLSLAAALDHGPADRRIAILREIGAGGSISEAARSVGVSYKAAWQALDTLTNLAGVPLVERVVGGAGGGGAMLTPAGQSLLDAAAAMDAARAEVLARLSGQAPVAARLALRTSMRNQWPCVVEALQGQGPLVRVQLRGADAQALQLVARITRESAELLALAPGLPVLALAKATAVQVQRMDASGQAGGENRWPARITRVARGEGGDEVAAQLDSGVHMVGFAAASSGLRVRGGWC